MKSIKPAASRAIKTLSLLEQQAGSALLVYWVMPNTVLTLAGARGYCDGIFYHDSSAMLQRWKSELEVSRNVLATMCPIDYSAIEITTSWTDKKCVGYDLIFHDGLEYAFSRTNLLTLDQKAILLQKALPAEQLLETMCSLLRNNDALHDFTKESLYGVAHGLLLGYPDRAIVTAIKTWQKSEHDHAIVKQLTDATIHNADRYKCPQPVYSYPKSMKHDPQILAHQRLWSQILDDFYMSDFHKRLAKDSKFKARVVEQGISKSGA